jgi:hypothetical protein
MKRTTIATIIVPTIQNIPTEKADISRSMLKTLGLFDC